MPNRIIRDAVLDSDRYHAVDKPARLAFLELLLCADDYGLMPLSDVYLKRHTTAFEGMARQAADGILASLIDQDLLRVYEVEGARFAFVPRFGNRPRAAKPKWPAPPKSLGFNDLPDKLHSSGSADAMHLPTNVAETETETEVGTEETTGAKAPVSSSADGVGPKGRGRKRKKPTVPNCPYDLIVATFHDVLPEFPKIVVLEGRKLAIRTLWAWVLTSSRPDGPRRAETAEQGLAWFRSYFDRVRSNDFLMGRGDRIGKHANWRCDLDYLLTQRGLRQVIEKTEVTS